MDATPVNTDGVRPVGAAPPRAKGRGQFGRRSTDAMGAKWHALHEAAAIVGVLAGRSGEAMTPEQEAFPALMRRAEAWRCDEAAQGIADITAIMEAGLGALLAIRRRSGDARAAARALLQEFEAARDSVMALLPTADDSGLAAA